MKAEFAIPQHWVNRPLRITLVGAGGTGSDLLVRLAKLHCQLVALGSPGFIVTVHDPDCVSDTNIGRQHFSPSSIGLNKAMVLVNSVSLAYGLAWKAVPRAYEPLSDDATDADLIITAVDKAAFRALLAKAFDGRYTDTLWLDTGNGADSGNVVLGHLGRASEGILRLPNVYDLWPELDRMSHVDDQAPSCSAEESIQRQSWPVNQTAAMLAAELLWTLFRSGKLAYHGYTFNLAPMTTVPMVIDTDAWSFFGYEASALL